MPAQSRVARPSFEALESRTLFTAGPAPALLPIVIPGLTPTILRSSVPTSATIGGRVAGRVLVKLTNDGEYSAHGTTVVGLFATPTGQAEETGTLLGSINYKVRLAAGQSSEFTFNLHPTTVLTAGTDTLVVADTGLAASAGGVTTAGPSLTVAPPTGTTDVPLTVSFVAAPPPSVPAGQTIPVQVRVADAGTTAARGPISVTLAITDGGLTLTAPVATLRRTVGLRPGHPLTLRLRAIVPTTIGLSVGDTLQVTVADRATVAASPASLLSVTQAT